MRSRGNAQTIDHALEQHGIALGRELKAQTVWNEAYEKTQAQDRAWLHTFFGAYLQQIFGYDGIYVLSGEDAPIYGFINDHDVEPDAYKQIAPVIDDLVSAVRNPKTDAKYKVVTTPIALGNGQTVEHRAVSDIRKIRGQARRRRRCDDRARPSAEHAA